MKTRQQDDFSKATYKKLIDDTFNSRRKFIERDAKSTKQIVGEYPFLAQPKHVSIKYNIVRQIEADIEISTRPTCRNILTNLKGTG